MGILGKLTVRGKSHCKAGGQDSSALLRELWEASAVAAV